MTESTPFIWHRRVSFGDGDPARIAYTGRIPEFCLESIDALWEAILDGENWFHMNVDLGMGTPFVHMDVDFFAPITPRAVLACHVTPARLGTTSITFRVEGHQAGVLCFRAEFVCVFVVADTLKKIPVPERIRAAIATRWPEA